MKEEIVAINQQQELSAHSQTIGNGELPGFGACSSSGCGCAAFVQNPGTNLCGNCRHNYEMHW